MPSLGVSAPVHKLAAGGRSVFFLRNAWYAVAWDRDIKEQLLAVKLLNERIVIFRKSTGDLAALEDACVHRKLPLSMGRLRGDQVECGYHGLVFGADGHCTRVPGCERIPAGAKVRSYPILQRYGLVWVWMGDPAKATSEAIFQVSHWQDPEWCRNSGGSMTVDCNYLLITDNLLDPSHVAWVHRTSFGNEACEETTVQTSKSAGGVTAWRWMRNVDVAPFYRRLVRFGGRCDRLQHYEVRYPCHAFIRAVFVPHGIADMHGANHPDAMIMDSYNFMTPIDESKTLYFWFQQRNFSPGDAELSRVMDQEVSTAFAEDRIVLQAVQEGFKNQRTRNIDLEIDRSQLLFRKNLAQLIAAENPGQWEAVLRFHRHCSAKA